jgi:hypothetical protein
MTFALDLQRFADKCGKKADDMVANVVVRVAAELDRRSPVGDAKYWKSPPPKGYVGGHFRANWQLGVGVRPAGEVAGVDPAGKNTLGRIIAEVPEQAAGKVYWLANNTPYSQRIEHGWSRQAPQGLVGLTVVQFQRIVKDAVEALPK